MNADGHRWLKFLNKKIYSEYTCPLVPRMAGGSVKIGVPFNLQRVIGGENEDA